MLNVLWCIGTWSLGEINEEIDKLCIGEKNSRKRLLVIINGDNEFSGKRSDYKNKIEKR